MTHTRPTLDGGIRLASWARGSRRSAMQRMLSIASRPGAISFALGLPAPELFPVEALNEAARSVLAGDRRALQYGPTSGRLRRQVVELMARRGVSCRDEQVFLTTGAQQGVNLLAHLLLDRGGQVIVEEMIYPGTRQVLELFQPEVLTVPTDLETGMDVDAVERLLAGGARPAFIYAITDGHNPLGVSLSAPKRERLVELARRYRVPVVEDDPYGFLVYDSLCAPPMRALDEEWVLYVGSFSKILAPTLRVGWMVLPESLIPQLSIVKEAADIDTSTFTQRVVSAFLDSNAIADHLQLLHDEYRARRDSMLRALEGSLRPGARWTRPSAGFFVWVELPGEIDMLRLLEDSIEVESVAFIPGEAFSLSGGRGGAPSMRLNFSHNPPVRIDEGVERLARLLSRFS
ncbi:MAG: PLP-dependent aminotransferase family protein [Pyrinomonadaceae bacterium]